MQQSLSSLLKSKLPNTQFELTAEDRLASLASSVPSLRSAAAQLQRLGNRSRSADEHQSSITISAN